MGERIKATDHQFTARGSNQMAMAMAMASAVISIFHVSLYIPYVENLVQNVRYAKWSFLHPEAKLTHVIINKPIFVGSVSIECSCQKEMLLFMCIARS